MSNFIERLYTSDEPAIRYKTRVYLFDENPVTPDAQELHETYEPFCDRRSALCVQTGNRRKMT